MLNLFLLIPLMTSIANGLDSSLINGEYLFAPAYLWLCTDETMTFPGLQILPDWQTYFHKPRGWRLGDETWLLFRGRASI